MNAESTLFLHCISFDGNGGGALVDEIPARSGAPYWLHLDVNNPRATDWLSKESGLKNYAIDALLAAETRPRTAQFEDGLLVVLRGVNLNPGADPEDMVSIRLWIDGRRVISSRRRKLLSVADVREALSRGDGPQNPGALLPALVERLANRIGDFVESIDDRLDRIESSSEDLSASTSRLQVAALRRQIAEVRRFLAPQRDALDRLNRQSTAFLADADLQSLRHEADRITRHLEDLDLGRERCIVLQEELLSRIAQEQNSRMYVLSVVAAIFLPLTFATGLLGMNVGGLPGLDSERGFLWSVIIMLVAGLGVIGFFRWKKWL